MRTRLTPPSSPYDSQIRIGLTSRNTISGQFTTVSICYAGGGTGSTGSFRSRGCARARVPILGLVLYDRLVYTITIMLFPAHLRWHADEREPFFSFGLGGSGSGVPFHTHGAGGR